MIVIGLTGSIGTGKSTVTRQFARAGAATLDSDAVVHRLLAKGGEAVALVAKHFPSSLKSGAIDRKALGAEVFGAPEKRKKLESIIHPLVRKAQDGFIRRARQRGKRFVVLDIPLLFETGGEKRCDYVVVTTAPRIIQRLRVLRRPGMTEERFLNILRTQMPDAEKRSRADFVIPTANLHMSQKFVRQILYRLQHKNAMVPA